MKIQTLLCAAVADASICLAVQGAVGREAPAAIGSVSHRGDSTSALGKTRRLPGAS